MNVPAPEDPRAQPIRDLRVLMPLHEADDAALTDLELLRKIDRKDRDEPR
jgi:hypothetical protein